MLNTAPGRGVRTEVPPGRAGCEPHTQQMKPDLIACSLGSTSNSSALGEEKLQIRLAFCPWHAEPGRKLFTHSQQ